jgi:hypothetical protein
MAGQPISIQVEGFREVAAALQQMGVDVEDLKDAFGAIAAETARAAAARAPRRTGRLAADVRGNRAKSKAVVTAGRAGIPYAGVHEYGWASRGIAAQPYLRPAADAMAPRAVQLLEDNINAEIRGKHFR